MLRLPDKQPGETWPGLFVDFANRLLSGETIASATVTCSVAALLKADSKAIDSTRITWAATAGTDGDVGVFTVKATGSMGSIVEAEVTLAVVES